MADEIDFTGVNLVCDDLETTLVFYRQLGVEIPEEAIWRTDSGPHHVSGVRAGSAEVEFDSSNLARVYNEGYKVAAAPGAAIIGFRLRSRDAVDDLYRRLTDAGHAGRQPPFDAFWGARYAIVADPDGRDVGLMSPVDPERRSAPPPL